MGKGGDTDQKVMPKASEDEIMTELPAKTEVLPRPWWIRGGMHVSGPGMAVNIIAPVVLLLRDWGELESRIFLAVLAVSMSLAVLVHGMRTLYCTVLVPIYATSLIFAFSLGSPAKLLTLSIFFAIVKVGVCMSACLHRYASHTAFKCGRATQLFVNILGCLANQGGPIWWASMHRCHHKYCDLPRDPHSAIQDGTEKAFSFFSFHIEVDEEFAPRHLERWYLRLIDTYAFAFVALEMAAMNSLFGHKGLFVAYTSAWLSQTVTLWFNVANHPEDHPGKCKASDNNSRPQSYYPPFHLFDLLYLLFAPLVGEAAHEHHHDNPLLAKRDSKDLAYYFFILPLEKAGLVWDVKMP